MKREIITYPDPVLDLVAEPIEEITEELQTLAQDMAETMYEGNGVGLAAPQVGESTRLIVLDVSGPEKREQLITLFNPIIEYAEGEVVSEEGCLSLPEFSAKIDRNEQVTVSGLDINGEPVTIEADGLLAICLQHEIDHLDGVLLLSRASRLKRSMYKKKVAKWLKRNM